MPAHNPGHTRSLHGLESNRRQLHDEALPARHGKDALCDGSDAAHSNLVEARAHLRFARPPYCVECVQVQVRALRPADDGYIDMRLSPTKREAQSYA